MDRTYFCLELIKTLTAWNLSMSIIYCELLLRKVSCQRYVNSEGRKFADLQIGGVFRDFNNERLILEFFHLIISYPKISRENQFWHYRALKNNRKVLMSRFDEGPSFEDAQFVSTGQSQDGKFETRSGFYFFPF